MSKNSRAPVGESSLPANELQLDFVYGYHGSQCRNNLFFTASGDCVYHIAAVGIVYNARTHKQKFFNNHTDDIISLSLHPNGVIAATAQIGKDPYICVWNTTDMQLLSICKGFHERGIPGLSFSGDGSRLASVGLDDRFSIAVWEWSKGSILASEQGHTDRIFEIMFDPTDNNKLVTCGVKHIKMWELKGNTIANRKGVFGTKGPIQTMLCLAFDKGGKVYAGTLSGDIYVWEGNNLIQNYARVHDGPIYTLATSADGNMVSGGKDGVLNFWKAPRAGSLWELERALNVNTNVRTIESTAVIRAIAWNEREGVAVLGLRTSELVRVDTKTGACQPLIHGHAEGELWGLATHPSGLFAATCSDDGTVRTWDLTNRTVVAIGGLPSPGRSIAYSPDGRQLAVGLKSGVFVVLDAASLEPLNVTGIKKRKEVLHDIRYSADGSMLAVASNDNFIDTYDVSKGYKFVGTCRGHSSFVTHIDFSADGSAIQSNDGAGEALIFSSKGGGVLRPKNALEWDTYTCVLGQDVAGIWPKYADKTEINALDRSHNKRLCATAADAGTVTLFQWPPRFKESRNRKYRGHSSHVTNVRFGAGDTLLLSTGGLDQALFQWKVNGSTAIHDEGSDAEPADFNSDVEDELTMTYNKSKPMSGAHPRVGADGSAPSTSNGAASSSSAAASSGDVVFAAPPSAPQAVAFAGRPRKAGTTAKTVAAARGVSGAVEYKSAAPDKSLELDFAYGYRIADTRNNVWYLKNGSLVWHTGALGVVYNPATHKMKFFKGHTDDIISLCVHPDGKTVATGQVGRKPQIMVWDSETLQNLVILEGRHTRGIAALSFSSASDEGKNLVSVGMDDEHSVVVYTWRKGVEVAWATGGKQKIFVCEFNPFNAAAFVTVGVGHISFWEVKGNSIVKTRGVFGQVAEVQTVLDISFTQTGKSYACGSKGEILEFDGTTCTKAIQAHTGACFCIRESPGNGFVSGGQDGCIMLWGPDFRPVRTINLATVLGFPPGMKAPVIRSITWENGKVLVGTAQSEIYELDDRGTKAKLVHSGHSVGELWGLATHPSKLVFATASDDKTVRIWDATKRAMINMVDLPTGCRSLAYSPDGSQLALGMDNGSVMVVNASDLGSVIATFKHRKEMINAMRYSPNGQYLAVGSNDNFVDVYFVNEAFKRAGVCSGNASFITQVDWSRDSTTLMTASGDYQQLFFSIPKCKQAFITKAELMEDARGPMETFMWSSWSNVLSDAVVGVWPADSDGSDINSADLNQAHKIFATGDDQGCVKLFNWPVTEEGARNKEYSGHSAHVTKVRWTFDNNMLITIGGGDQTILQWKFSSGRGAGSDGEPDVDDGFDSDVDAEVSRVYTPKVEMIETKAQVAYSGRPKRQTEIVAEMETDTTAIATLVADSGSDAAQAGLALEWVHGYRGHDTRNNVHYDAAGNIVWHTAGVAIVYNKATDKQAFYSLHCDDIISFAMSNDSTVVATGEVGKTPVICVWDPATRTTHSIIKGLHQRGVCALAFTCSGKRLISVGLDDESTVAVYIWRTGALVASGQGHKDKIFNVFASPDQETQFCAVGVKCIKFFSLAGNTVVNDSGIFGSFPLQTMMCGEYGTNNRVFSGSMKGEIYVWEGNKCVNVLPAHSDTVFDIARTTNGNFVTGGKDGKIMTWNGDFGALATIDVGAVSVDPQVPTSIRALEWTNGKFLIGTLQSEIYEVDERTKKATLITTGHAEGELWGLATHPSAHVYATASDDKYLRTWDANAHRMIANVKLPAGGRSVAYAPDDDTVPGSLRNGHIAVGLLNGAFMVFDKDMNVVVNLKNRREKICELKYSPNGNYLAVGSNDNFVDIYDCTKGYKRVGCCSGSSSFITHLDWTTDSTTLRTNDGAHELLYYTAPLGKITFAKKIADKQWATSTGVLGDDLSGIFPAYSDKTDVNGATRSLSGRKVVTVDDFGLVKVFNYPCVGRNAKNEKFVGHSSHVTNVRFLFDGSQLITVGGNDKSIFQWRVNDGVIF